jgi:hypothetical protein
MKYMLLIYSAEDSWTDEERQQCMQKSMAICETLQAEGKLIMADPLQSVNVATTVRVRQGQRQVTDGPFAETAEQLGGFYLIDVDHLDEAMSIAESLPPAKKGSVEIRPLEQLSPPDLSTAAADPASNSTASR